MVFIVRKMYLSMTLSWAAFVCSSTALAGSNVAPDTTALKTSPGFFSFLPSLRPGFATVQLGGYWSAEGRAQHINIESLIGDDFTVSYRQNSHVLVGLGYFLNARETSSFNMAYGLNAFYLAKNRVSGYVVQENVFTNLAYGYQVTHYPLYATAKSTINLNASRYALTVDAGIGPNFMHTSGFHETSLDGVTLPDHIFSGRTTTTFSATAGIGIKLQHAFGEVPLECGYRFFYLGQGDFNVLSTQVNTTLNTGTAYANALLCAIII